ncbi:hypothetical protein TYRP_019173 [Tyrophagus putrescentiae]|nr:hypothetical protein TYRP_019173 [Tyrophagus putrescentiae]
MVILRRTRHQQTSWGVCSSNCRHPHAVTSKLQNSGGNCNSPIQGNSMGSQLSALLLVEVNAGARDIADTQLTRDWLP